MFSAWKTLLFWTLSRAPKEPHVLGEEVFPVVACVSVTLLVISVYKYIPFFLFCFVQFCFLLHTCPLRELLDRCSIYEFLFVFPRPTVSVMSFLQRLLQYPSCVLRRLLKFLSQLCWCNYCFSCHVLTDSVGTISFCVITDYRVFYWVFDCCSQEHFMTSQLFKVIRKAKIGFKSVKRKIRLLINSFNGWFLPDSDWRPLLVEISSVWGSE